jgi:predicted TIM-barrel fold metal-dependent hydrolase
MMEQGKVPGAIDCLTAFGFLPERGLGANPEGLVELMAQAGISRALSLSATGVYHNFEKGNAETLEASSQYAQLIPVATIDPRYLAGSADEVVGSLKEAFKALRVFPHRQGWPLDVLPFADLAKAAAAAGLPIITELTQPGDATRLAEVASEVPVPLVVSCRGVCLLGEIIAVAERLAHLNVETSGLLGLNSVSLIAGRIGVERLLFGSNAPLYCPACGMESVSAAGLGDPDQEKVLWGNAVRVFGLEGNAD